jgi:uncharacterized protein YabE (DUF348 family)
MSKLKAILATALVGAIATLAAVSIHADGSKQTSAPTASTRIDTLDLMSKARDLPSQTFESPI